MNTHQSAIGYYDHNEKKYVERTQTRLDLDALREFSSRLPAGGKILDAGCGTGRDLRFFNRAGFEAEGLDASAAMVRVAQAYSGCRVWQADMMLLSLPKESYDGIWAHRSIIHLPKHGCQRVMGSFFAAIKPRGYLFVSIEEGAGDLEDRLDDPMGPARVIHRYSADDFGSLIQQSGFQIVTQGRDLQQPSRLGFIARRI